MIGNLSVRVKINLKKTLEPSRDLFPSKYLHYLVYVQTIGAACDCHPYHLLILTLDGH